jgi:glutamine synthetase type III
MASDYSMMDKVQIFLAKNHVLKWRDMLYHATVDFVGFLSMLWERKDHEKIYSEIGVEQEYFEIIFDCFKEEKHLIKDQLIKKKNLFTQQLYHHVIALTFGT